MRCRFFFFDSNYCVCVVWTAKTFDPVIYEKIAYLAPVHNTTKSTFKQILSGLLDFWKRFPLQILQHLWLFKNYSNILLYLFLKLIHYSLINSRGWVKSNFWIINFGAFASNLLWWYQPTASLSNWPSQTEEMRLVLWNNRFLGSIRASFFFN